MDKERYDLLTLTAKYCGSVTLSEDEFLQLALVVRCKDCKHWGHNEENDTYCSARDGLSDPEEDNFCSCGEQKEGDD